MDEEQKPEPKISLIEAVLIGIALVFVSIINLIPLVGDITSPVVGGLMFFYLYVKGVWGTSIVATNLVGYACGLVPLLQMAPTELAAWIITVWIDRHPKLEKIAAELAVIETGATAGAEVGGAEQASGAIEEGAEGGAAATKGMGGVGEAGTAAEKTETTAVAEGGIEKERESGAEGNTGEEGEEQQKEKEIAKALGGEEEREPIERLEEELLEKPTKKEEKSGMPEEETEKTEMENNVVSMEDVKKRKAQQIKEQLEKLKGPQGAVEESDENGEGHKEAA